MEQTRNFQDFVPNVELSASERLQIREWLRQTPWMKELWQSARTIYRDGRLDMRGRERYDPSHDEHHLDRILTMSLLLALREEARSGQAVSLDLTALVAIGHDLVVSVKSDPNRIYDTERSVEELERIARPVLAGYVPDQAEELIAQAADKIIRCSASKGLPASGSEEMVVRDADLLDCFGMIGILRFAAVGESMHRPLVETVDPLGLEGRPLSGSGVCVDAMIKRGLLYRDRLFTQSAREIAEQRLIDMERALEQLAQEMRPHEEMMDLFGEAE